MDDRIAERRREVREQRRRNRLRRTLALTIVLLLVVAGLILERSSLVALESVEVVGVSRLTEAEVLVAADLPIGTSTLRLDLSSAAARVEALPLVAHVDATRIDPLTVRIEVVERTPILGATTEATLGEGQLGRISLRLVDRTGLVIADGWDPDIPAVLVRAPSLPRPGQSVQASPALAAALEVHLGLPGPIRSIVDRYEAGSADDVDAVLDSGVRVRFGDATRLDEKARSLGAVLQDLGDTPISVIDVRAPSTPTVER